MRMRYDAPAAIGPDGKWFSPIEDREHRIDGVGKRLFLEPTRWDEQTKFNVIEETEANEER